MSRVSLIAEAHRLAAGQHGVAARRQLISAGVGSSAIDRRIRNRFLFSTFRGVYAVGRAQVGMDGLRMAAVLTSGDGAALGYRSAAALWGLLPEGNVIEVIRLRAGSPRRIRADVEGREVWVSLRTRSTRHLPASGLTRVRGIPVTTVSRTLADLSSALNGRALRRLLIEADRLGLLDNRALAECVARDIRRRGIAELRQTVADRVSPAGTRSLLEGLFLDLCSRRGLPAPEVNARIKEYEVDCLWRRQRLVVELDGYEFHRGREMFESDAARTSSLVADGWTVMRFTWRSVVGDPGSVADKVRRGLGSVDQSSH
jgi:hypothetical protein